LLTKGYDPVHIPSLHPWYISWQFEVPGERHLTESTSCFS